MEQTQNINTPERTTAGSHHEERTTEVITSTAQGDSNSESASRICDIVCMCISIGLGTTLGLLSRTGVIIISNELLKTNLSGIVWSNFIACFCMGLLVKSSMILGLPKDHNVYIGLTTGYCGTFSSFSSAALEMFNAAAGRSSHKSFTPSGNSTENSNDTETPILILRGISDFAGNAFVHIGVSFIGYHLGDTSATLILQDKGPEAFQWAQYHSICLKISLMSLSILILISSLLVTYFLRTYNFFIYVSFAIIFALPGTSLRYLLSKKLNFNQRKNKKRSFPLGTFVANALGSLVLAISTLLTLGIKPENSTVTINNDRLIITNELYCCALSAIGLGFCGALTTMSTFILELISMKKQVYVYLYAVSSVLITVGSFIIVWGSYSWSVGYVSKSTCV